jgi:hypothetical protein
MNNPSPHPCRSRLGGWWHYYRDDFTPQTPRRPQTTIITTSPNVPERASGERIHAVYTDLRRLHLVLSESHRAALRSRGLSDSAIELAGYRSTPPEPFASNVARALAREHDLLNVPGFYRDGDVWRIVDAGIGFYVPVRDHAGRICGMQIRRDEGAPKYLWFSSAGRTCGASSGAPQDFTRPELVAASGELLITEGALKSQIISELEGVATCGIAGVTSFKETFGADLRHALPELKRAVIAFDADFRTNENVRRGLKRLTANLRHAGLNVTIRVWSAAIGKGYDDALIALKGAA